MQGALRPAYCIRVDGFIKITKGEKESAMEYGQIVGQIYQIQEKIGHGGGGVVYKAYHLRLEKYVVIKKIKDSIVESVNVRTEADILKKLHHSCLPQVYDFIQQGSQVFTVMDYIDGYDLEYCMKQGISFPPQQLLLWLRELCGVLEYLHSQNPPILHSDIKPANIMVTADGHVFLIDFNVSFGLEEEQDILGYSRFYAAPEQLWRAEQYKATGRASYPLDCRMDLYSLGAVFYALVSGLCPSTDFGGNVPLEQMCLPEFAPAFLHVIDKAMRIDPKDRYSSAKEMSRALADLRKLDMRYRKVQAAQIGAAAGYAAMVASSVALIFHGVQLCRQESFQEDYGLFCQAVQERHGERAFELGQQILNQESYHGLLKRQTEEKAAIFHGIGNYYYDLEDYRNASLYYEKAVRAAKGAAVPSYYQNYAVALAREGEADLARHVLRQSEEIGLEQGEAAYIRAEIAFQEQSYEEAKAEIQNILSAAPDAESAHRAYLLQADIFRSLGEVQKQISSLEEAKKLGESTQLCRKLGAAYVSAARQGEGGMAEAKYYKKAEEIYEELSSASYPSIEDRLNWAIVCLQLGKSYRCERILLELQEEEGSDYRVWMYLAFAYEHDEDEVRMRSCCQEAVRAYEASGNAGNTRGLSDQIAHLYDLYGASGMP